jgi:hypothetical protein
MNINDCIYNYDDFYKIANCISMGDDAHYNAIYGDEAEMEAVRAGYNISGYLLPECLYIFRWTRDRSKLIPARVSMHPKTAANIMRGSRKYGIGHIQAEI